MHRTLGPGLGKVDIKDKLLSRHVLEPSLRCATTTRIYVYISKTGSDSDRRYRSVGEKAPPQKTERLPQKAERMLPLAPST